MASALAPPAKAVFVYSIGGAEISQVVPFGSCVPRTEPWIALVGDCFFHRISEDVFSKGSLHPNDCPLVISYRKGRLGETMDVAEAVLPRTIEVLYVHLGANNLTAKSSNADRKVSYLRERLSQLRTLLPHLHTVVICLLTSRTVGRDTRPAQEYIDGFNQRVSRFNQLVLDGSLQGLNFSVDFIEFNLLLAPQILQRVFLRATGFGPNYYGVKHIGSVIEMQIYTRLGRNPEQPRSGQLWPIEKKHHLWR